MKKIILFTCGISISLFFAFSALAAGIYAPIYQVNDSVVTQFELDQRIKMLQSFDTSGDLPQIATDQLIEDRLRLQAAKEAGISTSDQEVIAGMEEFARRGDFSLEELLDYFLERDIHRESFEDFVRAGLLWRNVVTARFGPKANVSDDEVDAALDGNKINFPKMVNVAEIILPISERGAESTRTLANRLSDTLKTDIQFSFAAKKFSKSETAVRGGNMGWVPLGTLPAEVAARISELETGQVTAPINLEHGTIVLYQLRGTREAQSANDQVLSVSYLQVTVLDDKAEQSGQIAAAKKLINASDTCLDMQANVNSKKFGGGIVSNQSLLASEVPVKIGAEIEKLDPNEASYFVTESGAINIVMLCNRAKDLPDGARDQLRNTLLNQRIGSFGAGYLQELRGDAIIITK